MESLLSFSERKGWMKPRSRGGDTGFGILTHRVRAEDDAVQAEQWNNGHGKNLQS
jgi:hypothetical protein